MDKLLDRFRSFRRKPESIPKPIPEKYENDGFNKPNQPRSTIKSSNVVKVKELDMFESSSNQYSKSGRFKNSSISTDNTPCIVPSEERTRSKKMKNTVNRNKLPPVPPKNNKKAMNQNLGQSILPDPSRPLPINEKSHPSRNISKITKSNNIKSTTKEIKNENIQIPSNSENQDSKLINSRANIQTDSDKSTFSLANKQAFDPRLRNKLKDIPAVPYKSINNHVATSILHARVINKSENIQVNDPSPKNKFRGTQTVPSKPIQSPANIETDDLRTIHSPEIDQDTHPSPTIKSKNTHAVSCVPIDSPANIQTDYKKPIYSPAINQSPDPKPINKSKNIPVVPPKKNQQIKKSAPIPAVPKRKYMNTSAIPSTPINIPTNNQNLTDTTTNIPTNDFISNESILEEIAPIEDEHADRIKKSRTLDKTSKDKKIKKNPAMSGSLVLITKERALTLTKCGASQKSHQQYTSERTKGTNFESRIKDFDHL